MKSVLKWTEGMVFQVEGSGHSIQVDAKPPIGKGSALTPKELVVAGLGGCTAMDVIALLKKHKQPCEKFTVEVTVEPTQGKSPVVFTKAEIEFQATGNIDKQILLNSVELSQTKYCGVSAMLSKAFPIQYKVLLNGEIIGTGSAKFSD